MSTTDPNYHRSHTQRVSSLQKGGYVVLSDRPCQIDDITNPSDSEIKLTGTDLFTKKKYEEVFSKNQDVDVPNTLREKYTLVGITSDGYLSLVGPDGALKEDMQAPDNEFGDKIKKAEAGLFLTILSGWNEETVVEVEDPEC